MKKLIVLFALASVAAAIACGGGDNKPANDPSTTSGGTGTTDTSAPAGSGSAAAPAGSSTAH